MKLIDILKEKKDDDFGDVALGSIKAVADMQGAGQEEDTKIEKKLIKAIQSWVLEPSKSDLPDLMKSGAVKRAKQQFPKIFAPNKPMGTLVYRGVQQVSEEFLEELANSSVEDWKQVTWSDMYVCSKPVNYSPRSKLQSWTYDPKVAEFFKQSALLITKLDDDFYFNDKAMAAITSDLGIEMNEKEVIHYGRKYSNPVYIGLADHQFERIYDLLKGAEQGNKPEKKRFQSATSYMTKMAGGEQ